MVKDRCRRRPRGDVSGGWEMSLRSRIGCFVMPFKWIVRGCFDLEAAGVAWYYAIFGRPNPAWAKKKKARGKR